MRIPPLFHYKYSWDSNFTEAENLCFESNYDNYYIYDAFVLTEITHESSMWQLQPFSEEKDFGPFRNKFFEIDIFVDGEKKCTTTVEKLLVGGIELGQIHNISLLTESIFEI